MTELFNEYIQNLDGSVNTLYKYYLFKAIKGAIDLNKPLKKLKEETNLEWSRRSKQRVFSKYFKGCIYLFKYLLCRKSMI